MPNGAHLSKTKIKKQAETEGWQSFGNHAPNFNKGPSILKSVQFVSFLFHVLLRLFNFFWTFQQATPQVFQYQERPHIQGILQKFFYCKKKRVERIGQIKIAQKSGGEENSIKFLQILSYGQKWRLFNWMLKTPNWDLHTGKQHTEFYPFGQMHRISRLALPAAR